jgi:SsrA-binding protein
MSERTEAQRDIARNRQAFHLYEILDKFEAGMVLLGPEVKSIRAGHIQLKDAYALVEGDELWLYQCHVSPYSHHTHEALTPVDPLRKRKLLMHKREILKLKGRVEEKGLALVPLRVYLSRGSIKVELGLGRGKKIYDKKEALKERDIARETQRALRER